MLRLVTCFLFFFFSLYISIHSSAYTVFVSPVEQLRNRLEQMAEYLSAVLEGRLPPNNKILYNLQHIFNLLPNLASEELVNAFNHKSNDQYLVVYISALVRSITSLHDLVVNKIKFKGEFDESSTDEKVSKSAKIADGDTDMKDAKTEEAKCTRCWHHRADVGSNSEHEELCGRCVENVAGDGEQRQFA